MQNNCSKDVLRSSGATLFIKIKLYGDPIDFAVVCLASKIGLESVYVKFEAVVINPILESDQFCIVESRF